MGRTSFAESSQQSMTGLQASLVFSAVPAAADQTLIGQRINGSVLSVNGDYYADSDVSGLTEIEAHLRATLAGGATCAVDAYTTYADETTKKTAMTGVASLVSTVILALTLAATKGTRVLRFKFTVAAAGTVTFTLAEINGA